MHTSWVMRAPSMFILILSLVLSPRAAQAIRCAPGVAPKGRKIIARFDAFAVADYRNLDVQEDPPAECPDLTDALIIAQFRYFLGRTPSQAEINIWKGVNGRVTRQGLNDAFATSAEARLHIKSFYTSFLGREASAKEVDAWIGGVKTKGMDWVKRQIEKSKEAEGSERFGNDGQLSEDAIHQYFLKYLGRTAEPKAGREAWQKVSKFHPDSWVKEKIATSEEAKARVTEICESLTGKEPTPEMVDRYLQVNVKEGLNGVRLAVSKLEQSVAHRAALAESSYWFVLGKSSVGDPKAEAASKMLILSSPEKLRESLAQSAEGQALLKKAFREIKGRDPSQAELDDLTARLAKDGLAAVRESLRGATQTYVASNQSQAAGSISVCQSDLVVCRQAAGNDEEDQMACRRAYLECQNR